MGASSTPRRAGYDVTHSKHLAESSTQKSRSRLLRGKKLKPVELCSYTLAHKIGKEMMWSMMHNNSKARVPFSVKLPFVSQAQRAGL
ncbi:hypothetical protein WJX79_008196 [Trebouxia sp. C0005]